MIVAPTNEMNTLPLDLWFKISSYDISIFMAMMKTFSWFRAYMIGKEALFYKTFMKIKETLDGISWLINNRTFRQDGLPSFISSRMISWRDRSQDKPYVIRCFSEFGYYHNDISCLTFRGHVSYITKTYHIKIDANLTMAEINFIGRGADNIPSIGIESVNWCLRTDMCKPIEIIFDGSLIYKDNERQNAFQPTVIDGHGWFI